MPAAPPAFTVAAVSMLRAPSTSVSVTGRPSRGTGWPVAGRRDGDPAVAIGEGDGGRAEDRACGIFDKQVRIDERLARRRGDLQTLAGGPHALDAEAGCGAVTRNI